MNEAIEQRGSKGKMYDRDALISESFNGVCVPLSNVVQVELPADLFAPEEIVESAENSNFFRADTI